MKIQSNKFGKQCIKFASPARPKSLKTIPFSPHTTNSID